MPLLLFLPLPSLPTPLLPRWRHCQIWLSADEVHPCHAGQSRTVGQGGPAGAPGRAAPGRDGHHWYGGRLAAVVAVPLFGVPVPFTASASVWSGLFLGVCKRVWWIVFRWVCAICCDTHSLTNVHTPCWHVWQQQRDATPVCPGPTS